MNSVELFRYQIRILAEELRELETTIESRRDFWPLWLKELYWTVTKLVGLGHWHDGSRPQRRHRAVVAADSTSARALVGNCPRPRVLIDATHTVQSGRKDGVQRVVRNIAFHAARGEKAIPFVLEDGLPMVLSNGEMSSVPLEIEKGDILVLLDVTPLSTISPLLDNIHERGGKIVSVVYDLVPLKYPGTCPASYTFEFKNRLETILAKCDSVIAISNSVVDDLERFMRSSTDVCRDELRLGWFHLGCDLDEIDGEPSPDTAAMVAEHPFFVTVGTIEPRKGHPIALDAFERLWAAGSQARYVIAGRYGWSARAVVTRIRNHPEFGKRLLWVEGPDDATLQFLYRNAAALVSPSIAEGFGLPLIEAARYGTSIIVSDLPVFREICGQHALYFDVADDAALAQQIDACLSGRAPRPDFEVLTWSDATDLFLSLVREDKCLEQRWRSFERNNGAVQYLEAASKAKKAVEEVIPNDLKQFPRDEWAPRRLETPDPHSPGATSAVTPRG
jgi:alpha-1,2-rhamnosyltransferase